MKALILAAGHAVRLYPLTKDTPKPLLEVGNKAILAHILEKVQELPVTEISIITNDRFYRHFKEWLGTNNPWKKLVTIINDGTFSNEDRLGAIGDMHLYLKQQGEIDDLLIIAGDNLFGFSLQDFVAFFQQKNCSIVAFRDLGDIEKVRNRLGVGVLQGTKVIAFEEKPAQPSSALAATACYLFRKEDLPLVGSFLELHQADSPGHFIKWLVEQREVRGFVFQEHWFDIGSFQGLEEARKVYA